MNAFLFQTRRRVSNFIRHARILLFKRFFFKNHFTKRDVVFALVSRYGTKGIEIGAAHAAMSLASSFNKVSYVDTFTKAQWQEISGITAAEAMRSVDVDIIDDANTLATLADESQEFVIANHVLEHCRNPIAAVGNMFRVLKPEGVLFLSYPDMRYTFDSKREITSMEHVCRDHELGPESSDAFHYGEWVSNVEGIADPQLAQKRLDEIMSEKDFIHFHSWTQMEMIEFFLMLKRKYGFGFEFEMIFKNTIEVIFILKKTDDAAAGAAG